MNYDNRNFFSRECVEYALDIHFFVKLSAGRRADYKSIVDVTNIVSEYAIKHSTTRWVTLRKVIVWFIEQHEKLNEHILKFSSKDNGFSRYKKTN